MEQYIRNLAFYPTELRGRTRFHGKNYHLPPNATSEGGRLGLVSAENLSG